MPSVDDTSTISTTPITRMKSIIPSSKSKNNLFMTFFKNADPLVKSSSQYLIKQTADDLYNENYWSLMFPSAAYFHVYNNVLGDVFAMVYNNNIKNEKNVSLSTFIISKHGCSVNPEIYIKEDSKYYPAIENLSPELKKSKVRKALAISLLKTFADLNSDITDSLYKQANLSNKIFDWDETQAGILASEMTLIDTKTPFEVGSYLYELGYLTQNLSTASYVVDVIYTDQKDDEILSEQNNALAFLLGKQLEQLFDPLTEYSPEPTEKAYKPPIDNLSIPIDNDDNNLIKSICSELITVQTNYTVLLVQFLQNFVVPLRIQVLEGKLPGFTTAKLNQIFPPTIDEVTRINCIFLDMLKLAQPYGSYEILKACGTTIPYFYKAQMRHEAAIKNFHANYNQFVSNMYKCKKSDLISFDQRTVETAVYSALNLVKIQLIIQRLVKNKNWPENLKENVQIYLNSCDNTISSFANDKLVPYNGRIFTPTGKILAEIAKGWPSKLQYGWLTRRVVAVFDAVDILVDDVKNRSVIIVFSDHALFLTIDDDEYYSELWKENNNNINKKTNNNINNQHKSSDISKNLTNSSSDYISSSIHKPSVSDILIHSLTNETPLTKLPHMTVKYWASINDLHALYFTSSINSEPNSPNSYVRFFNEKDSKFAGIYQLDKVSGKYVTEVLARSKILNKTQSFHLFCGTISKDDLNSNKDSTNSDLSDNNSVTNRVYYTAHELNTYKKEDTKSPFIILFNRQYDENILNEFNVYAFITLNFISEDTVRLEALSRCKIDGQENEKLQYDVNVNILSASLSLILTELFATHMSLYNPMMIDYLLSNNGNVNSQAFKVLQLPTEVLDERKINIINNVAKLKKEKDIVRSVANDKSNRRKSLELFSEDLKARKLSKSPKKGDGKDRIIKKEVKFQSKPVQIKEKIENANNPSFINNSIINPKNKNTPSKSKKKGFFKFFNVQAKSSSEALTSPSKSLLKQKQNDYKNSPLKKKGSDHHLQLKPAKAKPHRKISVQSFGLFSHKSNNSVIQKDAAIDTDFIKPSIESIAQQAIIEQSFSEPSSVNNSPLAPALKAISQPTEKNEIVDSPSTLSNNIEKHSVGEQRATVSQADLTTTSTGLYVNSHFEFPMEPAKINNEDDNDNDSNGGYTTAPSTPRFAQLKDEPNHKKGYKDSVDLMGKLDASVNKNEIYDDDLFEISSPKNNENKIQSIVGEDIVKPKSIHSVTTQQNDVSSEITNTFTPKVYDLTPTTVVSSHPLIDNNGDGSKDCVNNEFIQKEDKNTIKVDKRQTRSPWRIMTLPVNTEENEPISNDLYRSQSFYIRFKNMRDKQERILKQTGINYVYNIDELPAKDKNALSKGFIFSPSINSNLDTPDDSFEDTNWTLIDQVSRSPSKNLDLKTKEKVTNDDIESSTIQSRIPTKTSISVIERKIVPTKPVVTPTKSTFMSESSSHYLATNDNELDRYNSMRSAVNVYIPYAANNENIHESTEIFENDDYSNSEPNSNNYYNKNNNNIDINTSSALTDENEKVDVVQNTIYHPEIKNVSNIELYDDDVDYLNINLDKMNLDFNMSLSVPDFSILLTNDKSQTSPMKNINNQPLSNVTEKKMSREVSIAKEVFNPDTSMKELTVGNLDDSTMGSGLDTSLCLALVNQTSQENMLLNVENKFRGNDNSDIKSGTGLSKSETLCALNALMKDKSYAYLQDVLNGVYEDKNGESRGRKKRDVLKNDENKYIERNPDHTEKEDAILDYEYEQQEQSKDICDKNMLKREMTDYDIAYYNKWLNSSMNYLSNYTNNEEVF